MIRESENGRFNQRVLVASRLCSQHRHVQPENNLQKTELVGLS